MSRKKSLKIIHLYPEILNLYGDRGNVITILKRCEWRGIESKVVNVNIGDKFVNGDIYFIGGGQDRDEFDVYKELLKHKEKIEFLVDKGVVFLCLCAGLQLFGNEFIAGDGRKFRGLQIVDLKTVSAGISVKKRSLGNIITKVNDEVFDMRMMPIDTLVGFENHIGQTYLGQGVQPLGFVLDGKGNNAEDDFEGAVYKNVYCSYLHGPLLPKNPHLADHLIRKALQTKYDKSIKLSRLDDKDELKAHKYIIQRERLK